MAGRTTRPAAISWPASIIRSSSPTRRGRSLAGRLQITESRVSSYRAGGPVFAWGWGPTRVRGGGAPRTTKNAAKAEGITTLAYFQAGANRRDMLRLLAACMADWWLPRRVLAQRRRAAARPERRVIVVTFGGGVRYE